MSDGRQFSRRSRSGLVIPPSRTRRPLESRFAHHPDSDARVFFWLLVGHAVADFPLQAGPMATEKCRRSTTPLQTQVPWYYWLSAHAIIHGGAVTWITGSLFLGLLETVVHWVIDFGKCENWFSIHVDQALHVGCKVLWCVLIWQGIPGQIDQYLPVIPRPT